MPKASNGRSQHCWGRKLKRGGRKYVQSIYTSAHLNCCKEAEVGMKERTGQKKAWTPPTTLCSGQTCRYIRIDRRVELLLPGDDLFPYFFLPMPPTLVLGARGPTQVPNAAVGHVVHAMELEKSKMNMLSTSQISLM